MDTSMLYAITDRRLYGACEAEAQRRLLEQTAIWTANGVDFIQLREKDLPGRDQVKLARAMLAILRASPNSPRSRPDIPRLLINGRPDIALAAGADGVHLPSGFKTLTSGKARSIFVAAGAAKRPFISVSCHTLQEVKTARDQRADCILFAPVFEKIIGATSQPPQKLPGTGLAMLEQACRIAAPTPVFALGGVTAENAGECLRAGAAGIAAIRLMQEPADSWQRLT